MKNKLAIQIILITGIAQVIFTQIFQDFFNSVAMDIVTWLKVIGIASLVIVVNELAKFCVRIVNVKEEA